MLAVAVLLTAACASTSPDRPHPAGSPSAPTETPSATPIHSPLLASDTDHRFAAAPSFAFLIQLEGSTRWGPLTATAGSVEEVHYRTDPGYREWRVMLPAKGEVVLTSTCHGCGDLQRFRATIVIG